MLLSTKSHDLVSYMPRERILTETDGPFAKVDRRSAMPWDAYRAVAQLSALWKIPLIDIDQMLNNNLRHLMATL